MVEEKECWTVVVEQGQETPVTQCQLSIVPAVVLDTTQESLSRASMVGSSRNSLRIATALDPTLMLQVASMHEGNRLYCS